MKQIIDLLNQSIKNVKKQKLILSVSGGVDSMVMLDILYKHDYQIEVVHFNHQKREQSNDEVVMVQSYCEKRSIPFHYFLIDVDDTGNFHHQAHTLRKHYLVDVAKEVKSNYVLTAHHLDDLLESILIKLTRGSNLLGYAGMQPIYEKDHIFYVKPLLYTTKQDLLDYASIQKVPYMSDQSNDENYYLRNRYRHAVSPIMKQENPNLLEQVKQYHYQVTDAFKFIRKLSIQNIQENSIDLLTYQSLDPVIQNDIIAYLLESNEIDSTYEKITAIRDMLNSKSPNQTYDLNHKFVFIKAYQAAYIEQYSSTEPVFIKLRNGKNSAKNMEFFTFLDETSINTEEFTKLCYNELAFPLWLRHRLNGDVLAFDYGHKKLKKLLIDRKVPMRKRDQLWVLTDNNNQILWVENYYLNQTLGKAKTLFFKSKGV